MNRRDFLKSIAAVAAVAYLPDIPDGIINPVGEVVPPSVSKHFSNGERYGNTMMMGAGFSPEAVAIARKYLIENALLVLPAGARYELILSSPMDHGRKQAMAWYADAKMQSSPVWRNAVFEPEMNENGRMRIGELTT